MREGERERKGEVEREKEVKLYEERERDGKEKEIGGQGKK